jgi:hypothetical protein
MNVIIAVILAALISGDAAARPPMSFLFAHVSYEGIVTDLGGGITQSNLSSVDGGPQPGAEEAGFLHRRYCFTGLPALKGGQVTQEVNAIGERELAQVTTDTGDPACSPFVVIGFQYHESKPFPGFHLLLY